MDNSFFDVLEELGKENNILQNELIEKVKSAMLKAAKKSYPDYDELMAEEKLRVVIDPATRTFQMCRKVEVIDGMAIDENEITLAEARLIDPNCKDGDFVWKPQNISNFGRAAAQTAKQSIRGDLRDINRERILKQFEPLENHCITVTVKQVEAEGTATVSYGDYELYLFPNEQIPGENLNVGQNIKVYITQISNRQKKPLIKISRVRKELVEKLFELEVKEIQEGIVKIMSVSREAGFRSKVAVCSTDENVDAIGACIGPKRVRRDAISEELNGEKIDLIPYSENIEEFIARALSPAKVVSVTITSEEEHTCSVIVPNDQLSLAIGNKGQNAKLAAKLTGYKIDIKAQTEIVPPTAEEAQEETIESTADSTLDTLSVAEEETALNADA